MISLEAQIGLPLRWLSQQKRMEFFPPLEPVKPALRRLEEMREVLYDSAATGPDPLYYMYRDLALPADKEFIARAGLRFDVTVLVPGVVGKEYVKTAGHYHPCKEGTTVGYPEVYEVLHGTAHYLLQLPGQEREVMEAVYLFKAGKGDKVFIPPGFGHITINTGNDFLVMSNWVASAFSSVYEPFQFMGGGAYYGLKEGNLSRYVPNPRYRCLPNLRIVEPPFFTPLGLEREISLYEGLHCHPEKLKALTEPEKWEEEFREYQAAW